MRSIFEPFCTVIEARDGKEALELYGQYRPDLIIADMILPRVSDAATVGLVKLTCNRWMELACSRLCGLERGNSKWFLLSCSRRPKTHAQPAH